MQAYPALLGAGLLFGGTIFATAGTPEPMALSISGAPGATFSGACTYDRAGKTRTLRLEGSVPFTTEIAGRRLQCRLSADRPIAIEARKSGNTVRSATSGGTLNLRLE